MLNEGKSRQVLLSVLGVAILVVAVVGISFALFNTTGDTGSNSIQLGTITMAYAERTNGMTLANATPRATAAGKIQTEYFEFDVTATATKPDVVFTYDVSYTPDAGNNLPASDVRFYLTTVAGDIETPVAAFTEAPLASTLTNEHAARVNTFMLVNGATMTTADGAGLTQTTTYRFRMWVNETATLSNESTTYKVLINVDGTAAPIA